MLKKYDTLRYCLLRSVETYRLQDTKHVEEIIKNPCHGEHCHHYETFEHVHHVPHTVHTEHVTEKVQRNADGAKQIVKETANKISETAEKAKDKVKGAVSGVKDSLKDSAAEASRTIKVTLVDWFVLIFILAKEEPSRSKNGNLQ
jgi:ElaB/YqjD/DUF883 family membrane-anchored ribosome-binding protein